MRRINNDPIEILIAEDSPTQAELLKQLLEEQNYRVHTAKNGKLALDQLTQLQPALVISDVIMPELDGYGLCKAIKSDDKLKHIPVMLVTTLSDPGDVIRGLECGADNFIRKPYDAKYLLSRIDYLLMNVELRKNQRMQMALEIDIGGKKHFISAERQQILDLLVSTYEQAVQVNSELKQREKELAHSNQVLQSLSRIAEGLNSAVSEREVAEIALRQAMELPGIKAGWIFLRTEENDFRLAASIGLPPALSEAEAFTGNCACRHMLINGELDTVCNIIKCERIAEAKGDTQGLCCHATVPLWLGGGRSLGVMNLAGHGNRLFNDDELKVLHGVGNQVAVALERAMLHQHLEQLVVERTAKLAAEIEERKRIEQEQARLVAIIEATPDMVATADPDGRVLYYNSAARKLLGLSDDEDISAISIEKTHPEWAAKKVLETGIPHAIAHGSWSGETAILSRSGMETSVSQVIVVHRNADGKVEFLSTIVRDITQRKANEAKIARLNRVYAVLSGINTTIVHIREEAKMLTEACHIAVDHGQFAFAWIGKFDADSQQVIPVAQAGHDEGYLAQINLIASEGFPGSCALTTQALTKVEPVVCNDIAIDERMADWRDSALSRGYRSVAVLPLKLEGHPFGVFALYAAETGAFDDEEMKLLIEMSGDISYALDNYRLEVRRKQAEDELRKLSLAVEQSPNSIVITDLDANIEYVNEGFVKATGYSREEVIGKNPSILHSGKNSPETYRDMWAHLTRGEIWKSEFINRRKNGTEYIESIFVSPVRDANGHTTHYLAIKEDITERKLAENEVKDSRENLHRLLNSMFEGVYGVDTLGNCTFVNQSFLRMLGYDEAQEVLGKHIHKLIHHSYADGTLYPASDCKMNLACQSQQTINVSDEVFWRKDGVAVPVEYWSHPIVTNGEVTGAIATFIDITERKQAELKLLRLNESLEHRVAERTADLERARHEADDASRAKSAFLATMSHEIRTPMNGVIGMIDVLMQSSLKGSQVEMVNIIHDSAFALLAIIDDILDFSKIEAGKLLIDNAPMSVCDAVEGVCRTLDRMALKKNVELTLFTDPAIPELVFGDTGRLRQILINLVNNAVKFSSGPALKGKVSLRALVSRSTKQHVMIEFRVADNGIGIDQETLARLFTPFTQANFSTTRIFGGTGLGLAITHQLVTRMGGEVLVQSEPGKGSLFSVSIPFTIPDEQPLADKEKYLVAGLSCLVVDGQHSITDDLIAYLTYDNAQVERVAGINAARKWLAECPSGLYIVVVDTDNEKFSLDELQAAVNSRPNLDIRYVVIGRGGRRKCRIQTPTRIHLDAEVMHRRAFINAVAIAAGRAKESDWEVAATDNKVADKPLSREKARRLGRLILVAEDNDINQKVILQQLKLLGQTADITNNGRQALTRWMSGDYGMLITDLHMPEMDGYELTAAIRAAENTINVTRSDEPGIIEAGKVRIPIIAITANATKGEAEHCIAVGMDDYLSKPVQLHYLKAMLQKWMPITEPENLRAEPAVTDYIDAETLLAVDVNVLKMLVGDEDLIIRDFLHDFRISAKKIAIELRTACMSGQADAAEASAHKLKSSARSVGALALGKLCEEIEKSGKAGDHATLTGLLELFEQELICVENFIEDY